MESGQQIKTATVSRFQDRAVAYAMLNPTFKSYMLSKPVSWFMEHSNNLYNNMVHGDVTYVMPLVEYEQAGTDTLLGPAVAEMGASHANVFNSMMLTLLDNASVDAHALGLVCRTGDPGDTLMAHLALAVGIDDTLLGCDSMAAYLTDNVAPPVISGAFTELIRQPGAPLAGYSQWLVSDTNIYNYNMYSDPGSDYQAILQASGAYYADRAKMRAFFDAYSGAANLLATVSTEEDLLRICYNADLPAFLTAFDSIVGSAALDSAIAEAGVHRTPMAFASSLFGSTGMPSVPAFWTTYDTILNGYSFGLAEHDFYGSSRLGIKTYWPGQVGAIWDMVHHTADTIRLWERKPWYSAEYQDVIKDTSRELYDNTHTTAFQFKHINGQRQYEVTDHLGDVLATLSDARNASDTTTPDSIDVYTPVVHSAYDYYPFGMYMPGRHTEDSATHCNWFTQAQTIRVYDSTWVGWTHTAGGLGTVGGGVISPYPGGGVTLSTTTTGDGLAYAMSISPGDHEFDFDIAGSSADYLLTITEGNNLLASTTIPTSTTGIIAVPFTVPGGVTSISVGIGTTTSGAGTLSLPGHWHVTPRIDTVNVLTSVCSGEKYPYGFNGKYKDNEWAGKGNHYDYGARFYDPRIARWLSIDPLAADYQSKTPYNFGLNNPIFFLDHGGKKAIGFIGADGKLYIHATYNAVTQGKYSLKSYEMSNIQNRVNDFYKGAVGMKVTLADGRSVTIGGVKIEVKPGGDFVNSLTKTNNSIEGNIMMSMTPAEIQKKSGSSTTAAYSTNMNSTVVNATAVNSEQAGEFLTGTADKHVSNQMVDEVGHALGTTHPNGKQSGESSKAYNTRVENQWGSMERGKLDASGELILSQKDMQNIVNAPEFKLVADPTGMGAGNNPTVPNGTPANGSTPTGTGTQTNPTGGTPPNQATQGAPTQTPPSPPEKK